jgi:hypothetical protein
MRRIMLPALKIRASKLEGILYAEIIARLFNIAQTGVQFCSFPIHAHQPVFLAAIRL